jgi:hypothetical protein
VIVFLSPECPVANADVPVLNALAAEFAPRGFSFVGAYADPALSLADLRRHAAGYRLAFPAVDDRARRLVRAAGATFTPEVCVFSRAGALLYRGRIDDRVEDYGAARPSATHEDLREVLAALAAGPAGHLRAERDRRDVRARSRRHPAEPRGRPAFRRRAGEETPREDRRALARAALPPQLERGL